jgi:hypothetical protein
LDHVKASKILDPVGKFTDWERFQSLTSALVSPRVEINSCIEVDKAARDFAVSIASAFKLSNKTTGPSGLERLLEHKKRLRKLWQETRNPVWKTAVNWAIKIISRVVRERSLERCEVKIENCDVILQEI